MHDAVEFHGDLVAEIEMPTRGILSRTVSKGDSADLVLFAMAPGEELSEHTSAREAVIHVLSGTGRLAAGGEEHRAGPGAWLRMPAGTAHALAAETPLVFALYLMPPGATGERRGR